MKSLLVLIVSALMMSVGFAEEGNAAKEGQGATWRGGQETHAAHWRPKEKAQEDYLFHLYRDEGMFVEGPAHVGAAIGMVPGVVVGSVLGVPMIPFERGFTNTLTSTTLVFGKAGSAILGFPFWGIKKIFWDAPRSVFEE